MELMQSLFEFLSDPTLAYVLLVLGLSALLFEMAGPGYVVPGVVGAIATLVALYLLATMQVSFLGVALIGLAFVLLLVESLEPGFGVFGAAGLLVLLVGSVVLMESTGTSFGLSALAVTSVLLITSAYFLIAVRGVAASRRKRVMTGREGLVRALGEARTDLDPRGLVLVDGELWHAVSPLGRISAGQRVQVHAVEGMRLIVYAVEDTY
jgi:membrane-bound serine protease (ClpP class)